jgi:hypothetical protein
MTRGGKRKGAGRKADPDPRRHRVMVRLADGEIAALDAARGDVPRSEAIRELVLKGLGAK